MGEPHDTSSEASAGAASRSDARRPPAAGGRTGGASLDLARFTARLGLALISCGESVARTHVLLRRVAAASGVTDCSFYTLPTGSIAVVRDTDGTNIEMEAGGGARTLRLDQVQDVYALVERAGRGELGPADALTDLDATLSRPPRYHPALMIAGHGIATLGFSLVLQLPWAVTGVAVLLGLLAGALRLVGTRVRRLEIIRPVLISFVCGCVVFLLARQGMVDAPYHALIPPLLLSLPFVPLTLATLELADRQMVSGATRLAYALVQVVFLVFGLVAAQQLVDLPPALAVAVVPAALGWWAPWVGTLLFAAGVALHFAAPPRALPWLFAVCFAARVGLVVGDAAGSAYVGAMLGAALMAVVADWSAARAAGPTRLVTFSPTFILLIPGALALTGLTQLFGPERDLAFADLSTAMFIIVAIAVGLMIGLGLYEAGARLLGRRVPQI